MAAAPTWKIYDETGIYQAATHDIAAAAVLVAFYGDGATIRAGHRLTVWTEGAEIQGAAESYDYVSEVVCDRLFARKAKKEES